MTEDISRKIRSFEATLKKITPGDPEYTKLELTTIGGSQLGSLFHTNQYETYQDLVAKLITAKCGKSIPFSSAACGFGIAFEPAAVEYISRVLSCFVYCRNNCIIGSGDLDRFRYSPDGIGKVYRTANDDLWTTRMPYSERARAECVLFELKCPVTRRPQRNGGIPKQYLHQVLGGLIATEGLTQRAIFVDAVFRLCAETQLGLAPGYNTTYHHHDSPWMCSQDPLAWGQLKIYRQQHHDDDDVRHVQVDYGAANNNDTIDDMFCNISTREWTAYPDSISLANGITVKFLQKNTACVGVIPF